MSPSKNILCLHAWLNDHLATVYLVLFAPFALALCFLMPAMQVQDEWAHFARSVNVAYGHPLGERPKGSPAGGQTPVELSSFLSSPVLSPDFFSKGVSRLNAEDGHQNPNAIYFGHETQFTPFPFVQYPPTSYLFSSIGIDVARIVHIDALSLFYLARLFTLLASLAMAAFALHHIKSGKYFAFFALATPMTLSLFGSVSQDAALIGFTALAISILQRSFEPIMDGVSQNRVQQLYLPSLWAAGLLSTVIAGRPPYITLAGLAPVLFFFFTRDRPRTLRILALGLAFPLLWIFLVRKFGSGNEFGSNHGEQIKYMFHHPIEMSWVFCNTIYSYLATNTYLMNFVAALGSHGCSLPDKVYLLGGLIFLVVLLHDCLLSPTGFAPALRWKLGILVTASFIALHLIGYVFFTVVAAPIINGLQGRYFIPLAIALTLSVGSTGAFRKAIIRRNFSPEMISLATLLFMLVGTFMINVSALIEVIKTYYYV